MYCTSHMVTKCKTIWLCALVYNLENVRVDDYLKSFKNGSLCRSLNLYANISSLVNDQERNWNPASFFTVPLSVAGEYLGCFPANDITEHRKMMNDNNMTISICSENCHKSGFKIYGLRYGSHCYCFNNDSRSFNKSRVDERQCNTHCKGGPKCGGDLVIAITKLCKSPALVS